MTFTTTIMRKNWEMKMRDHKKKGYFYEYKSMKEHWNKRIPNLEPPCSGVFIVGRDSYLVEIQEVLVGKTHQIPERYAPFVETEKCYILKCVVV